jgi:hypothetical protein
LNNKPRKQRRIKNDQEHYTKQVEEEIIPKSLQKLSFLYTYIERCLEKFIFSKEASSTILVSSVRSADAAIYVLLEQNYTKKTRLIELLPYN